MGFADGFWFGIGLATASVVVVLPFALLYLAIVRWGGGQ